MPYKESECYMLSAIQHYAFCPRQCALIHKEQFWADSYHTVKGDLFHERVHNYPIEKRKGYRREFSMPIHSLTLGVSGQTDLVDIQYRGKQIMEIIPVEYKSGKPKQDNTDAVQLCAQAICLEEMTGVSIPRGFLYYGKTLKRHEVLLTEELRRETKMLARELHQMMADEDLPEALHSDKCKSCSIRDYCQPVIQGKKVQNYLNQFLNNQKDEKGEKIL
ncbi:MAG: CRISPR-associated protein Cas4 [Acidobacteria bacterium]|nr:MAG: CRISPR-associated protein Cas4 [Acidobacteriota bacterium]